MDLMVLCLVFWHRINCIQSFFSFLFFCCCYKQLGFCFSLIRTWSWCVQTAPFSSSPFPGTPSVIVRGHRGPFISPWEWGWGRGWCRGMRAKAGALCQVTKAFQNNNSYHSLPEPVGLYGSPWDCAGMCRCQWKDVEGFWKGCWWWGSVSRHVSRNGRALLPALIFYTPNVQSKNKIPMILVIQRGQTSPVAEQLNLEVRLTPPCDCAGVFLKDVMISGCWMSHLNTFGRLHVFLYYFNWEADASKFKFINVRWIKSRFYSCSVTATDKYVLGKSTWDLKHTTGP